MNRKPKSAGYVLVVDDEEHNRTLLVDTLEARGYEIAEAEDGAQALEMARTRVPDVILLDVMMPNMDGFVACRELKLDPRTAPVPVLMITALSERRERLMGIEAGANDFLNKPVDLQDVILRVGNAVYTKRLYDRLQAEQEKSERLLLNILPKHIAERMKAGETHIAERFGEATVLFADLVGFTDLAAHIPADELLALLNEVFTAFDAITARHGFEKIKTIGDAYMAAGGLMPGTVDCASAAVALAKDMHGEIEKINLNYNMSIRLRVGINQGPVIAGIIGTTKFSYDLWGDTVNMASRLESMAQPGTIQIAPCVHEKLKDAIECERHDLMDKNGHRFTSFLFRPDSQTEPQRKAA
jgi:class 3 adenylate cyclase